jgi:hypothetical protein
VLAVCARMVGLCCVLLAAALRETVTGTCEPPGVRGDGMSAERGARPVSPAAASR